MLRNKIIFVLTVILGLFVIRSAASAATISSCGEITQPGSYILTANLTRNGDACVKIHDTTNVQFDCIGHSIHVDSAPQGYGALSINNVTNFTLTGCILEANVGFSGAQEAYSAGLFVGNSWGEIKNNAQIRGLFVNTRGDGQILGQSSNLRVTNNLFTHSSQIAGCTNCLVQGNTFNILSAALGFPCAAAIDMNRGSHNQIVSNTIDGKWDGVDLQNNSVGCDDGITFDYESFDTISDNQISNNWDSGIETTGLITDSHIMNNMITNSPISGIGAWWGSSWRNNVVSGNTVIDVKWLFYFTRYFGLLDSEQFIYFENNQFTNNKLSYTSPAQQAKYANYVPSYIDFSVVNTFGTGRATTPADLVLQGNTFTNNDFTLTQHAPFMNPASLAVDGGGNVCNLAEQSLHNPLVCHAAVSYSRTISITSLESRNTKNVSGTLEVYTNPAKSLLGTYPFTTDNSGVATISLDIPVQSVFLRVRAAPFLSRMIMIDLGLNTTYIYPTLLIGDINQDGIINAIDFSTINSKWFTSDSASDLNKDGFVNSLDFSWQNKNWFKFGES